MDSVGQSVAKHLEAQLSVMSDPACCVGNEEGGHPDLELQESTVAKGGVGYKRIDWR